MRRLFDWLADCDLHTVFYFAYIAPMAAVVLALWVLGVPLVIGMVVASIALACFWFAMAKWDK
jgi:hypothetical protein